MARIFWDTNLFIYLIEERAELSERVQKLWAGMKRRGDHLYTSTLTVGEVLTKPSAVGARDLEQKYLQAFQMPQITVLSFDLRAAIIYARVRRDRSMRPPDAIQLACAAAAEVDLLITNDQRLSQQTLPEIKFITSLDRSPI